MHFTFEVGDHERHSVQYHFNQSTGFGKISIDDKIVKRIFQMLSMSTISSSRFSVGKEEVHNVEIQRERKRAFGGLPSAGLPSAG
jgi:hypothetical protein